MHGGHQRHRWDRGRDGIHDIECGRSNHVEHQYIVHFHDYHDWLPLIDLTRAATPSTGPRCPPLPIAFLTN